MNDDIDARYTPDQTYPTESGHAHPPAPPFPAPSPGQAANVPDVLRRVESPEQRESRARHVESTPGTAPEHGVERPYSAEREHRVRPEGGRHAGPRAHRHRDPDDGYAGGPLDATRPDDPTVRNEKQLVADSHAEFPAEELGQRFEWRDGATAAEAAPGEARGGVQRTDAGRGAGGIGAFLQKWFRRR